MYFAHKLAQLPEPAIAAIAWTDRQTRTDTQAHSQTFAYTHTHTHTRRADML